MEENKKRFFKLDIFFWLFLLAVAGYFFYRSTPATAPSENDLENVNTVSSTVISLPEGVSVEDLEDGTRLVKNEKDGYSVKVEKDKYIYKDFEGDLKIQNYLEPNEPYGGSAGCSVYFSKSYKKGQTEIKKEFQNNCKEIIGNDCKYVNMEKVKYNNNDWLKFYLVGNFVGTNNPTYITYKDDYMYKLSFPCADELFINNIISNFSF